VSDHLDPTALTYGQVAQLANEAMPGTITRQQIQNIANGATYPVERNSRVNLWAFIAYLRRRLKDGRPLRRALDPRSQTERMRDRDRAARDIGPGPAVKDRQRREACRLDLPRFLKTYLPNSFPAPFSEDHLRVLAKTQGALLGGGLFAEAVFRGFGKTTMAVGAAVWCACHGHKRYIPLVCADRGAGEDLISDIQAEFEDNDVLMEDFPGACWPMRCLEGISHRCRGQMSVGRRTMIELKTDCLVLPTMLEDNGQPAASNGIIVRAFGLTGRIRGLRHRRKDGSVVRPDFAIIDDPQTDDSARSPSQCDTREKLITGAILGLAGHSRTMSAVMPCTVIRKGDLVDRLLDHSRHPEWQGARLPMVKSWAKAHDTLWLQQYADLRRTYAPNDEGGRADAEKRATAFYSANRAEMDAGAVVSWAECYGPGELSAIQHAYNLLIDRGAHVFQAEYQLEPIEEFEGIEPPLEPADVAKKVNGLDRYQANHGASLVVSFIDLGSVSHMHWLTCWFGDGFTGGVLDRGVVALERGKLGGVEAALTARLAEVTGAICRRSYLVAGGGDLRLSACMVDSGWQAKTVYEFCRQSPHAAFLIPSKGIGAETQLKPSRYCSRRDQGDGWHYSLTKAKDARILFYNTDHFKSFANERLRTGMGGRGCVSLWGREPKDHWALAEHLTAERPESKTLKNGDKIAKWRALPGRPNHWFDCFVGCHVGAMRLGMALDGMKAGGKPRRDRAGGTSGGGKSLAALLGRT